MTVVGDTDLWLFLSSAGAFTAGRVQADRCLFSYETDDRLHELGGLSGPVTAIRFDDGRLWTPLRGPDAGAGARRTLRRSPVGDLVQLEETDSATGLRFRVELTLSDRFGVVRRCELAAPDDGAEVRVRLIDGYVNVMPAGVPLGLQQSMSTLVDGYKRSELVNDRGLALYTLETTITDQPQAIEALHANAVWRTGLDDARLSLDARALRSFERGEDPGRTHTVLGRRGAYLCHAGIELAPGETVRWSLVADAHLDHSGVARLDHLLRSEDKLDVQIERSVAADRERLEALLDAADGAQATADVSACAAHRSNVLFNAMRGGVPIDTYAVDTADFRDFVRRRNRAIADRAGDTLGALSDSTTVGALRDTLSEADDPQLARLALEYLPLTFGRRHGDPSRPWNRFRIQVRDAAGERLAGYEGNWRDIFQNWEAMTASYPEFLPGIIAKFVNASTVDGYNPYRINEAGIDWEVPEPGHDMAGIGYWGDHQIVYLLRLLERCRDTLPGWLESALEKPVFSYARVPYRIKPFDAIARDPRDSIAFDDEMDAELRQLTAQVGGDGRLVLNVNNEPALVNFIEKLLVPALCKASNLVPGGGIWMNTQRPEWNDANNALAGYGLSMVTLYQLRQYAEFAADLIARLGAGPTRLSGHVASWRRAVHETLRGALNTARSGFDDRQRWETLARLGAAFETARLAMYDGGPGQPVELDRADIVDFFNTVRELCDASIRDARRSDGLYHSYNVLHLDRDAAAVEHLAPMLEGQVAVLSSGTLAPADAADLLDALFESPLYREDQRTFIRYPRVELPRYMDRNRVPGDAVSASPLLARALDAPEAELLTRDSEGVARFHADVRSHEELDRRLDALAQRADWADLVASDRAHAHDAFERTFQHARFTGRSGRMHKYEGLGSVYWHMVSKLLLAAQECAFAAKDAGADPGVIDRLRSRYADVRNGLGFRKTPAEFGAVPHEPYSHTPWNAGAQQPGMTGQVKEGVLARLGELGVRVGGGAVRFDPLLLEPDELLDEPRTLVVRGALDEHVEVPAGAVGFSLCGTPVVLRPADADRITVLAADGSRTEIEGARLSEAHTRSLFDRIGAFRSLHVEVAAPHLARDRNP